MEYQLAIIGGGPAGYTAAYKAAKAGLNVILFEKNSLGGICLNEGCIPTKTMLHSAHLLDNIKDASKYGVNVDGVTVDLPKIITRKNKVVRKLTLGIKAKLASVNVNVIKGEAKIMDNHSLLCNEETYRFNNLIVCTGSDTAIPHIEGLDKVDYWTYKNALDNTEIIKSLLIIGGGVIGMELASFFNSIGTKVTIVEMMDDILLGFDKEIAELLRKDYEKKGVDIIVKGNVVSVDKDGELISVTYEKDDKRSVIEAEKVMVCVGRRPVTKGYGLENLNLETYSGGRLRVNEFLQSSVPNIYICGDLNGISLLAHTAIKESDVAVNHILGIKDSMHYDNVPAVVYTNPEVAFVGKTEEELQKQHTDYKVIKMPLAYAGRFVADNEGVNGLCKVMVSPDDVILGVHILGNPASEIIVIANIAIEKKMRIKDFKKYIFPHPTVGEILHDL